MTRDIKQRTRWGVGLAVGLALLLALCGASRVRAADDGGADPPKKVRRVKKKKSVMTPMAMATASAADRIDALSGDVDNLRKSQSATGSEVEEIKKELVVAAPQASATPSTIGQHVGALEAGLAATQKSISDNLGVNVHGLVDAGYEHNFNQSNFNYNYGHAWDENGFQLTQGNLHIEKDGTVGFVTDLNVGQVANSISNVTHYSIFAGGGPAGQWFDPTQYYLTYTAPIGSGLSIAAGRFVTLLGEEIIPTYQSQNFNESRGLLFNLGEPLTHTGIRASYTINDYVAVTGGLNNGWDDPAALNNGGPTAEGELSLNNKDKSVALVVNGIIGSQSFDKSNSTQLAIDPIFTWKPAFIPNTTLASEYLYGSEDGQVIDNHSASWQGFAQYVVYDWNEWEFATRGEFFKDQDGARSGPNVNGVIQSKTLWEITQTITYKVPGVTGLLLRGEYRHDASSSPDFGNNDFVDPNTGIQHLWSGQDLLSGAMIYAF